MSKGHQKRGAKEGARANAWVRRGGSSSRRGAPPPIADTTTGAAKEKKRRRRGATAPAQCGEGDDDTAGARCSPLKPQRLRRRAERGPLKIPRGDGRASTYRDVWGKGTERLARMPTVETATTRAHEPGNDQRVNAKSSDEVRRVRHGGHPPPRSPVTNTTEVTARVRAQRRWMMASSAAVFLLPSTAQRERRRP